MTSKNHDPLPRPYRWRLRLRRLAIGAAVVAVLLAIGTGVVIYQHDYDIREEKVEITNGSQTLDGVLAKPREAARTDWSSSYTGMAPPTPPMTATTDRTGSPSPGPATLPYR